ncbi:MAG: aldehyde dehydrogenase [Phycisphaeraceae bacterium]|nr:MAG: aldehyde dehydrogenase [Phycisphaeraceae bacterium]
MERIANYIAGELVEPAGSSYLESIEPATGKAHALAPDSDAGDVDSAVAAAAEAFPAWAATPAEERSKLLLRIAELIEQNLEALAQAESRDTGKPITLARRVDIPRAAANFRFFATAILHEKSELHATDHAALNYTLRRPRGVAGLISPWNLPLYLFTWKIAPALATGNTAVGKPSEVTPLTAFHLSKLCIEAGLPPGVLNIVHGRGGDAGAALVAHPKVTAISFTGGTKTGAAIAKAAAPKFKKLSLELGGKNPNIIFADADMDLAIAEAARAAFTNQGQICLCGSRILVERSAYERVVEGVAKAAKSLVIGDPMEDSTQHGALVSREHLEKVETAVELAREEGGTVIAGGERAPAPNERCAGGYFYRPTVVTGLGADCRTEREEIFGPVVTISSFENEDEAIARANDTVYGLASMVWTNDLRRAHRVAERIESGIVWINCWMLRDLRTPFGGVKKSGVGREGGEEALRFFTEPKNVCVKM